MDPHTAKCCLCDSEPRITCKSCQLHFCKKCVGQHVTTVKGERGIKHEIIQFIHNDVFSGLVFPQCAKHKNQNCELQCCQCRMPVCPICVNDDHKEHDINGIPMLVERKRLEIRNEIDEIEANSLEFIKIEKQISTQILEINEKNQLVISEMDEKNAEIKNSVNKIVSDYKELLEETTQENAKKLCMFHENIKNKLEMLQLFRDDKIRLLHSNVALDILDHQTTTVATSVPPLLYFDPVASFIPSTQPLEDLQNLFGKLSFKKPTASGNLLYVESNVDSEDYENEDLLMKKNEVLIVERKNFFNGSSQLSAVRLSDGKFGCIHRNHIIPRRCEVSIQLKEWWLPIGIEKAELILSATNVNIGTYFISKENDSSYTMSIRTGNSGSLPVVSHVLISKLNKDAVYLERENVFPHLQALIEYYEKSTEFLNEMPCRPIMPFVHQLPTKGYSGLQIQRENIMITDLSEDNENFAIYSGNLITGEPISIQIFKIPHSDSKMGFLETANDILEEAEIMRSFSHENILNLMGVAFSSQPIALITGPVDKSLRLYVENLVYYCDTDILKILKQIIRGMGYLHQQGFAHGWLCAENIYVREPLKIKIGMFQFTTYLATDPVVIQEQKTPLGWSAPELYFEKRLGTKSDVWSFGMLLYEIVTFGLYPFADLTDEEIIFKMAKRYKMPKPKDLFRENYYQVMQMCWCWEASDRPTFRQLEEDFEETFILPLDSVITKRTPVQLQEYWLPIGKKIAEEILLQEFIPRGTFFICEEQEHTNSDDEVSTFTLSVKYVDSNDKSDVIHLQIAKSNTEPVKYYLNADADFPDMSSLLEHFQAEELPGLGDTCILNETIKHQKSSISFTGFEIDREAITLLNRSRVFQMYDMYEGHVKTAKKYSVFIYKLPDENSLNDEDSIPSFKQADDAIREALNLCKFSNENVLEILGMCSTASPLVMVTELVKCTLLQHLQDAKLTFQEINDVLVKITNGMDFLHESKYAHRDLCASNILLGERNTVKVGGLHFAVYLKEDPILISECEEFPLQLRWCAPEILSNTECGTKSDVWSLGVVLFEIISKGEVPYTAWDETEIIEKVVNGYRIPRPVDCTDFHHEMMGLCWKKDFSRRPPFRALNQILTKQGSNKSFKKREIQKLIKQEGYSDFLS